MKKIIFLFVSHLLLAAMATKAQSPCESVTAEAFGMQPQMGAHNYFGVRVSLPQTYHENVTVNGYIHKDADENGNQDHPFTLTIMAGSLTAETAANFYQTDPTAGAAVKVSSVTPCPNNEITANYAGVSVTYEVNAQILRFNSVNDLNTVLDQLDADYESDNENYENQYPNLTEDELDDMDVTTGFDEFRKFRDFENLFQGFASKRSEIENAENIWLSSSFSGTDPDDVDLTFDDVANTIFNSSYSFKIGGDIYQLTIDGMHLNGNLQASINNSIKRRHSKFESKVLSTDYAMSINTIFRNYSDNIKLVAPGCKSNKKIKSFPEFGNDDRYKLKVAINSWGVRSGIKSKVVHFEKKNGSWKRSRAKMAAFIGGRVYNNDCNLSFIHSERNPTNGWKKRRQLKVAERRLDTIFRTYTGEIGGSFDSAVGHAGSMPLVF